jgi:REP element-mobilizing transposase RayT
MTHPHDILDTFISFRYPKHEVITMPRYARKQSEAGIYHVMLRGINQTQLFYDDDDRNAFLERLKRFKSECGFLLYAYCLMGNHVHLLLQEADAKLPVIIQKITLSYSHWFNSRYERSGYLFQGRYKSKPVNDNRYLLAVLRYIHNNPVKIGEAITSWTSYEEYTVVPHIIDTGLVFDILDADPVKARERFVDLMGEQPSGEARFLGEGGRRTLKDSQAIEIIKRIGRVSLCSDLLDMDKDRRDEVLALLKKEGLSIRQISRLTEINRGIIQNA